MNELTTQGREAESVNKGTGTCVLGVFGEISRLGCSRVAIAYTSVPMRMRGGRWDNVPGGST